MACEAYLHARTRRVTESAPAGLQALKSGGRRGSYYYVPPCYRPSRPAPLVVLLHGAGGHAHHGLDILRHLADDNGLILVGPASAGHTWDVIVESAYGTDLALIDRSLDEIFSRYAVDDSCLAIGGFSDGASYALSVGLPNGDLFTHIIAFSPGFFVPSVPRGLPKIFISHGIDDAVLPIARCSRKIAPRLERDGYDATYHEFGGGHEIPVDIARLAVEWLMNRDSRIQVQSADGTGPGDGR